MVGEVFYKGNNAVAMLDVISSVDYGYRFIWAERQYLRRLIAVPLAVKLVCFIALAVLGWEQDFIRMALVMLPSFFTEGWMLAHVVRLVFHNQRWPFQSVGDRAQDEALLMDRAYGVMAGTLFYVVTKFLLAGLMAFLNRAQVAAQSEMAHAVQTQSEPSMGMFFLALIFLIGTLWGFRFLFLYIPAAAGLSLKLITRVRQSFMMSMEMLGIWLVCFVPFALLTLLLASMLVPPDLKSAEEMTTGARFLLLLLQVGIDTMIAITSTAAVAWGLRNMIEKPPVKR